MVDRIDGGIPDQSAADLPQWLDGQYRPPLGTANAASRPRAKNENLDGPGSNGMWRDYADAGGSGLVLCSFANRRPDDWSRPPLSAAKLPRAPAQRPNMVFLQRPEVTEFG